MQSDQSNYFQDNDKGDVTPCILWDTAKAVFREKIARTALVKRMKAKIFQDLQEKLKELEQAHITNKEPAIIQQIRSVKQEIDQILSEEIEKNIRFMKQRYYEAGPKAAKLLAWRLRRQQAENTIHRIRDQNTNKIISNLDGIQKVFETYYRTLYSQPDQADRHTIVDFFSFIRPSQNWY